jgi:uncharacterized phage protein (TIGR01671 family)
VREILFRGKPKHDSEYYFFSQNWKDNCKDDFVYGSLVINKDRYYICVSALCNIKCCVNNGMTSMIEVIPETVGEYTGFKDKNGTLIFEGDYDIDDDGDYIVYVVELRDGAFCFVSYSVQGMLMPYGYDEDAGGFGECDCLPMTDYNIETIEIKGNIHNNPKILEGE